MLLAVVAVVVTALAIVLGRAVLVDAPADRTGPAATPAPGASATPLADYDREGMTLARGPFCGRISAESAALALGVDAAEDPVAWRPGMKVPGTESVANEWGCSITAGGTERTTASAWVFGTPVGEPLARSWARETGRGDCTRKDVPEIGAPGVVVTCPDGRDKHTTYQGLVGDTWLACRVSGTGDAERVGRWCVVVLEALRAD
ncbi:hypothetical protein ASG94_04370 [Nocardioides sp. Soil805]|nr:hypothetical protein ASG94_04370 [Nocardioides sp. Soil805]